MVAQREGFAPDELTVRLVEGLDEEALELRLTPTDGVRITVTLPGGRPASSFSIVVLDASGRALMFDDYTRGSDGTLLSVPPGTWELLISAPGMAVAALPISIPSQPITVSLGEQALLRVRVPELERDLMQATVDIVGADGRRFRVPLWRSGKWPLSKGQSTFRVGRIGYVRPS